MIDQEPIWKDRFSHLPNEKGPIWTMNIANATDQGVTNKMQITNITGNVVFTFNKAVFALGLLAGVPAPIPTPGALTVSQAWMAAVTASVIVVPPGSSFGSPAPTTTWSVVASSIIDPPSIAAGGALLFTLLSSAAFVPIAYESIMGPALYKAFKTLTVTVTGTNSDSPTTAPLVAPLTPVM